VTIGVQAADIQAVPTAFVPVMKTVISGVEVDLLFARVNLPQVGVDVLKYTLTSGWRQARH